MNIAFVSDSHGNVEFVKKFCEAIAKYPVDQVVHLGDNYIDANVIVDAGYPCITVPGTWCESYLHTLIDNRRLETFNTWNCLLSHTPTGDYHDLPEDIDPQETLQSGRCDILCHGHTHKPEIRAVYDGYMFNPGHIKADIDRGYPATFAYTSFTPIEVQITIIELLTDTVYHKQSISR